MELTLREIASCYDVSPPALLRYRGRGVDLMNPQALVDEMARGDRPSPVFDRICSRLEPIRRELSKALLRKGGNPEVFGLDRI